MRDPFFRGASTPWQRVVAIAAGVVILVVANCWFRSERLQSSHGFLGIEVPSDSLPSPPPYSDPGVGTNLARPCATLQEQQKHFLTEWTLHSVRGPFCEELFLLSLQCRAQL